MALPTIPTGPTSIILTSAVGFAQIEFDALLTEEHAYHADITNNPIAQAADKADHIQPQPFQMNVRALATATPVDPDPLNPTDLRPDLTTWRAMVALWRAGGLVHVRTAMGTFRDMAIQDLGMTRDDKTGLSVRPKMSLVQVSYATSKTIRVPVVIVAKKVKAGAPTEVDRGKQASAAVVDQSVLSSLVARFLSPPGVP